MHKIKLRAPGKINWTLDVTGRRADGYHEVEMLMQSIGLWDEITLTKSAGGTGGISIAGDTGGISIAGDTGGIGVAGDTDDMPLDDSNIAVKAAKLVKEYFNISAGVEIEIRKQIPIAAGLAGGSTNAAAVLVGLNALWNLGLSDRQLEELGLKLGADVPFCIRGGTAVARGIGEKLTSLAPLKGIWLVLVKPPFGVSTSSVYNALELDRIPAHPDWQKVYSRLKSSEFESLQQDMTNVLETVTAAQVPEIHDIRHAILDAGAAAAGMTGSGPTVFGVFQEQQAALEALYQLKKLFPKAYAAETIGNGVEVIKGGSRQYDDSNQCNCISR